MWKTCPCPFLEGGSNGSGARPPDQAGARWRDAVWPSHGHPFARLRAQGRQDDTDKLCRTDRRAGAGINKAKVALARKLAVVMLRMLKDNVPFNPAAKAATA
jgi:hypothetical protein